MKLDTISTAEMADLNRIPEACGAVAVGCTDVAGVVEAVIASSEQLRREHDALRGTVTALEADQNKVAEASDEARLLSERAIERLNEGTSLIQSSLGQINELLAMVDTLGEHVTSFSAAMEQVRRSAQDIDDIAETTNILALNATIEAMRAGDAGRTFAVVASEVKSLANDTRRATDEITKTIESLGDEASVVIGRIENGSQASGEAKASVARIESTLTSVSDLVEEVDKQNDVIARSTGTISGHVDAVQKVVSNYDHAARTSEKQLHGAHDQIQDLELTASEMFDRIVHAGLSPQDNAMVAVAQEIARDIVAKTEAAVAKGELAERDLFDTSYQPVKGSNPQLYRTGLSDWADKVWRPIFDAANANNPAVIASACTNMDGFLPTQMTDYSRAPIGDIAHDTRHCRNGRIILEAIDKRAKQSDAPFMMAVYRQEGDGKQYRVVRNVYVPITLCGRRWGDYEVAYTLD